MGLAAPTSPRVFCHGCTTSELSSAIIARGRGDFCSIFRQASPYLNFGGLVSESSTSHAQRQNYPEKGGALRELPCGAPDRRHHLAANSGDRGHHHRLP